MTAGRTGGGLSIGRSTENVVDEEVDVLLGDVVTAARVLATTVATARVVGAEGDVNPPFCTTVHTDNTVHKMAS